jgi:hypothetical protein
MHVERAFAGHEAIDAARCDPAERPVADQAAIVG